MKTRCTNRSCKCRWYSPRLIVWLLLITGFAWFIAASPKTPLEFFDAGVRDDMVFRQYDMDLVMMKDPADAERRRLFNTISSYRDQMERIALEYDLTHHPERIFSERSAIIMGSYNSEETMALLKQQNRTFIELQKQIDGTLETIEELWHLKSADNMKKSDTPGPSFDQGKWERTLIKGIIFDTQMSSIRQFQAAIFFRSLS